MPIYEYECQSCQHQLEALQKMSDPALVDCPACGAASLKKRISAAGFRLSGTGWYETDFKTGKKKNLVDSKDGGASAGATSKSGTGSAGSSSSAAAPA